MELDEVMRSTATVRYYTDEPVDDATLHRVFERARFAPNGGNRQGWKVIVVRDPQLRHQLRDLYLEPWREYSARARSAGGPMAAPRTTRVLDAADDFAENLHTIPVHLVVCVRIDAMNITDDKLGRPSIVGGASIYPFVQNVLLACRDEGLGAALTTILCLVEPAVRELLDIPDEYAVAAFVPVGHPDPQRSPRRLSRAAVEDFAVVDRFAGAALEAAAR